MLFVFLNQGLYFHSIDECLLALEYNILTGRGLKYFAGLFAQSETAREAAG